MARTLLLHMGMGKTGSSALQVAFVRNREGLRRHGVLYPAAASDGGASRDGVTSGNAYQIARFLVPRLGDKGRDPHRQLDSFLRTLRTADLDTVLYSSEFLYQFELSRLEELVQYASTEGFDTRCVVYVRDVAGHALSEYSQQVKRGGYTGSFIEFIDVERGVKYRPGYRRWLTALLDTLGSDALTLIHYDSVRQRLYSHFAEIVLGAQLGEDADHVERTINRSLTRTEVTFMRRVNELINSQRQATAISDAMISLPPLEASPPCLRHDEMALLRKLYGGVVEWVNRIGVLEGPLAVESKDVVVGNCAPQTTLSEREEFLLALAARLLPR